MSSYSIQVDQWYTIPLGMVQTPGSYQVVGTTNLYHVHEDAGKNQYIIQLTFQTGFLYVDVSMGKYQEMRIPKEIAIEDTNLPLPCDLPALPELIYTAPERQSNSFVDLQCQAELAGVSIMYQLSSILVLAAVASLSLAVLRRYPAEQLIFFFFAIN